MSRPSQPSPRAVWWTIATIAAVYAVLVGCARHGELWEWLGVSRLVTPFADLYAILAANDAKAAGLDPYAMPSPFDPLGRPHVYGPWWLWLCTLGLGRADVIWLGVVLCVVAVAVMACVLRPTNLPQTFGAVALLASPPLLLSYERGNNDLVIVLLFAAAQAAGLSRAGVFTQALLIVSGAVLKFYPLAALPALAVGRDWRRTAAALALAGISAALALWIWRTDFQAALGLVPRPNTFYGYGLPVIRSMWAGFPPGASRQLFAAGLLLGFGAVWLTGAWRPAHLERMGSGATAFLFVAGGTCWVFCFLTNANFPYRFVLLVLVAVAWFRVWREAEGGAALVARNLVWLLLLAGWLRAARVVWVFGFAGTWKAPGVLSFGLEHGLTCGLSAVIAAALVRWGWQLLGDWWRELRSAAA